MMARPISRLESEVVGPWQRSIGPSAQRSGPSALPAPGECGGLLQGDAWHERIRMSVDELPAGPVPAKDLRDAQGPVLLRQAADLGAHPFDRHENDQIARGVGGHDLLVKRAVFEELRHRCPTLGRIDEAARRRSAERVHERVVLRVLDERQISIDVAAYQRLVRIRRPAYQSGYVMIGSAASCASACATDRTKHDAEHRKEDDQNYECLHHSCDLDPYSPEADERALI